MLIPDGFAVTVINMVAFRFQKYRLGTFDSIVKFDFAQFVRCVVIPGWVPSIEFNT